MPKCGSAHGEQRELYSRALEMLQAAKEAYVAGFAEGHPKVAWALEGMGKVRDCTRSNPRAQGDPTRTVPDLGLLSGARRRGFASRRRGFRSLIWKVHARMPNLKGVDL